MADENFSKLGFWEQLRRRKLRNYLFLNKKLQFHFALLLAVIGGINALYFGALIYFHTLESFLRVQPFLPKDAPIEGILEETYNLFLTSVFFAAGFQIILIIPLGLFFSHRIVGPLFVFTRALADIAKGIMPRPIRLRKHDLLTDFADQFNDTISALSTRRQGLEAALEEAQKGNLKECESHLQNIMGPPPPAEPASTDATPPRD